MLCAAPGGLSMKNSRQIAAAIDLRVRQLAAQTASDSALIDQMVGYMADLQRLWISTTDVELATLCEEYPGFLRYATLMENLSEALRTGVGVPPHIQQLPRLPDHFKRVMRSEEHTSELQSLTNIVCRLLLVDIRSFVISRSIAFHCSQHHGHPRSLDPQ